MLLIARTTVFIAASAAIYGVSRASLRSYRLHGFYRFFAWEAVLALLLLDLDLQAYQTIRPHHLFAMAFLAISGLLAIHGFHVLLTKGKRNDQRGDPTLLWVERTTVLVTSGAYHYVRHPLYSSFLLLTAGAYLLAPSVPGGALAVFAALNVIVAASAEERENLQYFGVAYSEYRKRTKMFIPCIV